MENATLDLRAHFVNVWMRVYFLLIQMELVLKKVILIMAGRTIW